VVFFWLSAACNRSVPTFRINVLIHEKQKNKQIAQKVTTTLHKVSTKNLSAGRAQ